MRRDRIIEKLAAEMNPRDPGWSRPWARNALDTIERAGFVVIDKEPTPEEIERVREVITSHDIMGSSDVARAAAAAVREG